MHDDGRGDLSGMTAPHLTVRRCQLKTHSGLVLVNVADALQTSLDGRRITGVPVHALRAGQTTKITDLRLLCSNFEWCTPSGHGRARRD